MLGVAPFLSLSFSILRERRPLHFLVTFQQTIRTLKPSLTFTLCLSVSLHVSQVSHLVPLFTYIFLQDVLHRIHRFPYTFSCAVIFSFVILCSRLPCFANPLISSLNHEAPAHFTRHSHLRVLAQKIHENNFFFQRGDEKLGKNYSIFPNSYGKCHSS